MKRWIGAALALIVVLGLASRRLSRTASVESSVEASVPAADSGMQAAQILVEGALPSPEREAVVSETREPRADVRQSPERPPTPVATLLGTVRPPVPLAELEARGELWRLEQTKLHWEIDRRLATPEQQALPGGSRVVSASRDGSFSFEQVTAGIPLKLELENPFGPPCSLALEPLSEGEVRRVEVELPRGAVITGLVLDQEGLPVRDALLRVRPPSRSVRQLEEDILQEPRAYSDAEGRFRIEKVRRGERQLSVEGPFRRVGRMDVDTTHGDVLDLVIRVDRGVELELIVLWPDRKPVERFQLELDWGLPSEPLAKDGRHTLRGLEPGSLHTIKVEAERDFLGRAGAVRSVVLPSPPLEIVLGAEGTSDVTIRLVDSNGEPREGTVSMYGPIDRPAYVSATERDSAYFFQDLESGEWLVSAMPLGAQEIETRITLDGKPLELKLDVLPAARVSGTVRDTSGRPVEGAVVGDETGAFTARYFEREYDKTDRDGRFSILPDAFDSRLVAVATGHGSSEPLALDLAPGEHLRDVELQLLPACCLTATVIDVDGEPIAGAWVEAIALGRIPVHGQTDPNGIVRFEDLPPGQISIGARHHDGASTPRFSAVTVELQPDQERKIELRFQRANPVRVHGRIVGQPDRTGAMLVLLTKGFEARLELDAGGRFEGTLPTRGRWRGRLHRPGDLEDSPLRCVEFVVPDVEEHELVVELAPGHVRVLKDYMRWITED